MVRLPVGEGRQRVRIRLVRALLMAVLAGAEFVCMARAGVGRDAVHTAAVMGKPVCAKPDGARQVAFDVRDHG